MRLVSARFSLRTAATWLWSCFYRGVCQECVKGVFFPNLEMTYSVCRCLPVLVAFCLSSEHPLDFESPPPLISCEDSPFGDTWCHSSSQCIEHAPSACSALSSQTQMVISVLEIGWGNAIFFFLCTLLFFKPSQCFLQHPTVLTARASRLLCMAAFHMISSMGCFCVCLLIL